jgi:hypothetical protein
MKPAPPVTRHSSLITRPKKTIHHKGTKDTKKTEEAEARTRR